MTFSPAEMSSTKFTGRPKEACEACRRRRSRCGRQRPSCIECIDRAIHCPGYKPKISLDFRDESQLAAQKVQARKSRQENATQLGQRRGSHPPPSHGRLSLSSLPIPVLDLALSFLVSHYLHGTSLAGLSDLYLRVPSDSPLAISVYAPALAALSIDTGQPALMNLARTQYCKAIQRTNQALGNKSESATDSTLASVLHLGLFESIVFDGRDSPTSWTMHVYGALELLKQRGTRHLDTPIGRELYVAVVESIRVSCTQQQIQVPQDLIDLDIEASKHIDLTQRGYRLRLILDAIAKIRFNRRRDNFPPDEIIQDCLRVEEMVVAFCQDNMRLKLYELVPKEAASPDAFEGREHRYVNLSVAKACNTMRLIRLSLCCWIGMAMTSGAVVPVGLTDEMEQLWYRVNETVQEMAAGILASVPHFLTPSISPAARFLIFPLSVVGEEPLIPPAVSAEARSYARERLRFIGVNGRFPQALRAAEMLEEGRLLEDWCHLSLIN